jgi:hypothetical protein
MVVTGYKPQYTSQWINIRRRISNENTQPMDQYPAMVSNPMDVDSEPQSFSQWIIPCGKISQLYGI